MQHQKEPAKWQEYLPGTHVILAIAVTAAGDETSSSWAALVDQPVPHVLCSFHKSLQIMPPCPSPPGPAGLGKTLIGVAYQAFSLCVKYNLFPRLKALCFAEIATIIIGF